MNLTINELSVLPALGSVTLEKSLGEVAATLTASLWTAAADTFFLHLSLAAGDRVILTDDDGTERFSGTIFSLSRTPYQVEVVAFDDGIRLTRNEVWGVFAGTGGDICRAVAAQLGMEVGEIDADPSPKVLSALSGSPASRLLRQAAGEDREIAVEGGHLTVRRQMAVTYLLPSEQLETVSARADLGTMVNRCVVVDYRGRRLAAAEHAAHMAAYGTFQTVLGKNGDDPAAQARAALSGRALTAEVLLPGNLNYMCGTCVQGDQPQWGLEGLYRIAAVCHRWEGGRYTTELTLEVAE